MKKRHLLFIVLCLFIGKNLFEIIQNTPIEEAYLAVLEQEDASESSKTIRKAEINENNPKKIFADHSSSIVSLDNYNNAQLNLSTSIYSPTVSNAPVANRIDFSSKANQRRNLVEANQLNASNLLAYTGGVGASQTTEIATVSAIAIPNVGADASSLQQIDNAMGEIANIGGAIADVVGTNEEEENPGGPDGTVDDVIPVDGGLSLLLITALGKGASSYKKRKRKLKAEAAM